MADVLARRAGDAAAYAAAALAAAAALVVALYVERVPSVLVPVAASVLPLFVRTARARARARGAAFLVLIAFVYLGLMTVGVLFVPSALAMGAAAALASPGGPSEHG